MSDDKTSKHTHEHHHVHHASKKIKVSKIQVWQIVSGILGLLVILSVMTNGFGGTCSSGKTLPMGEATQKALTYLNANVLSAQGATATISSSEDKGNLYNVKLNIAGREYDSYLTKDASLLFPSAIDLTKAPAAAAPSAPAQTASYPKAAKPVVDLYIMSYCPYGIQAQQGLYPVMELLGNDAEINIKWVPYIMHGRQEIDENTRQYCIQKEQKSKYVDYVACFVGSKDAASCGKTAGIDEAKVATCITATHKEFMVEEDFADQASWLSGRFPVYRVNKEEADALGVQGSPSMFINGQSYGGARTPEAYKQAICSSFENAPAVCGESLSAEGAAASGSCN